MNQGLKRCAAVAAGAVLLAAVGANAGHARDPYVGEWAASGPCAKGVQCWLEIERAGASYQVVYVAAAHMDASKVLCRVSTTMKRQPVLYGPHESYDDGLIGLFQGSNTYVAPASGGSLVVGGGLTAGLACDRFDWLQAYHPLELY